MGGDMGGLINLFIIYKLIILTPGAAEHLYQMESFWTQ